MNKLLKINFVLSAIFLSGCNGGKVDDYFKEYSFTQALSSEEKNSLYESMKENASSLKKISSKKETYEETELYKNTSSSELTTIFYDDPSNPDLWIRENNQNNRVSRCANGITFNSDSNEKVTQWDGGNGYLYKSTTESTKNSEPKTSHTANTIQGETSAEYKKKSFQSLIPDLNAWEVYKNGDGSFTMIASQVNKRVEAVSWGKDTKELLTLSKRQSVYSISKDFYINSYYSYQETKTNRDPNTYAWYDSERITSNSYTFIKYEYGTRDKNSIEALNKSIENIEFISATQLVKYDNTAQSSNLNFSLSL